MQERTKVAGGCACGEVRYGFYEPRVFESVCHCRSCQYASGGGPAYLVGVRRDQFRITRGHPGEFATLSEAGHLVTRVFCRNCGTHVYAHSDGSPGVCSVKVGTLDEPAKFQPKRYAWTSEAQPWHPRRWLSRRFRRNAPLPRGAAKRTAAVADAAAADNGATTRVEK